MVFGDTSMTNRL